MSDTLFEFSSGGVVVDKDKVLIVKTKNLKGEEVYTFPKGHIEKGERAEETAIREVYEETGYKCRIIKPLEKVVYWFYRDKQRVKKEVRWFLMEPEGIPPTMHDKEIIGVIWMDIRKARDVLSYPSDKKLIDKISNNFV